MSILRTRKKLGKRYGMNFMAKRVARIQDHSTFRQRVTKSFEFVGNGLQVLDLALATTYARGKRLSLFFFVWLVVLSYLMWAGHR